MRTNTLLLSGAMAATAFIIGNHNAAADPAANAPAEAVAYQPFETKLEIGPTTGVGVTESWRFMDHVGIRGGIDFWDMGHSATVQSVDYHANLRFMSEPITLDIYPWAKGSFHISLGAVINQNRLFGSAAPSAGSNVTLDGQTFTGAQVGHLDLEIRQQPVNPYVSVGSNFCFDKAKHWAFGWEAGVMYAGSPRVSLTQSGGDGSVPQATLDSAVAGERDKVVHYARKLEFWPVFKLGVSYAF